MQMHLKIQANFPRLSDKNTQEPEELKILLSAKFASPASSSVKSTKHYKNNEKGRWATAWLFMRPYSIIVKLDKEIIRNYVGPKVSKKNYKGFETMWQ